MILAKILLVLQRPVLDNQNMLKIITAPSPILRKKSKEIKKVDKKLLKLIEEMKETLKLKVDPQGVGLSAPQVGKNIQLFISNELRGGTDFQIYINPKIIKHSQEKILGKGQKPDLEGCLSVPNIYGPVPRYKQIVLQYQTLVENQLVKKKETLLYTHARVAQHEIDHLQGILFTDYIIKNQSAAYLDQGDSLVEIENIDIFKAF